jgi:hypothetical protein
MASDYAPFDVNIDNDDGTLTPVAGVTVKVYDTIGEAYLSDLTTDGDGHIDGDTIAVDPGTTIRFSVQDDGFGRVGYLEQVTT